MKAKFLALAALVLGMVSCQTDVVEGLHVDANGEAELTLQVGLPEVTRAAGADSALGAIGNVDMTKYDIRFILKVYDDKGELAKECEPQVGDAKEAKFSLRLVPGRDYHFVVWADFVNQGSKADLHYDTTHFPVISLKDGAAQNLNDESRDAYTAVYEVKSYSSSSKIEPIILTRPFAKLRVITTDMNQLYSDLISATVKYTSKLYTSFNALNQAVDTNSSESFEKTVVYGDDTKYNGEPKNGEMTLFADYFFGSEDDRVMFTLDVDDETDYRIPTVNFNTNIPVDRNYLTTVKGNILTDANEITVTIDSAFDQPNIDVEYKRAGTAQELVDIIEEINNSTTDEETHIVLSGDIDLSQLITRAESSNNVTIASGKEVVLDIQSYNISGTDNGTASFGLFNIQPGAKLTIEGTSGKIQLTATQNRGWNAYSSVISNQRGEFVLNGGTIEHLGGTDMAYGLDILTNTGSEVAKATINGGTVKSPYRAVRQFLNSTKALNELYVKGGTIEGANKSIWMQNANAHNNPGKLNVAKSAELKGDVYVYGSGASVLDIELSVAVDALKNGATVVPSSIPAGYAVYVKNGNWVYENGVAVNGDEVEICNAGGLKWVADQVNSGKDYFAGKAVKLVADIDLNNEEWTPIGSATKDHGFMGNFDGNGFVVKNLHITNIALDADNYAYAGLFGVTEGVDKNNQNSIKNLTIENVNINTTGRIVAAAIAYPYYTALENIKVNGTVVIKGGDYTAGVLAYTRRLVDAKNIAIEASQGLVQGNITVGGVISDIQMNGGLTANYSNFSATGLTINGVKNVGGISGIISNQILNGATVKNVIINCDDVREGIISGSVGEASAINNVVVENVSGVDYYVGATYDSGKSSEVTIDGVVYEYQADGSILVDDLKLVANGVATDEDGAYYISNKAGMFWFANEVNVNKNAFAGKTVKLTANIDLNNEAWTPVGQTGATTFNGVFDGQNYTISNLNVNSAAQTGKHYSSGLFGWVESHTAGRGHIKNVKINGATIVGHHNCGALVGYITQETALVDNCHVTGATVSCTYANGDADGDKAGALIGNATVATPVKNCTAANSTVSAGRDAGQLIGAGKEANVTGCSATDVTVSANGTGTGANVRNEVIGRLLN